MKKCSKCGNTKPLGDYHRDCRNNVDGRQSHCKTCRAEFAEAKRRAAGMLPLKRNDPFATEKKCTLCGHTKALSDFVIDRRTTDGKTSECKECRRSVQNALNRSRGMKEFVPQNPNAVEKKCLTCGEVKPITQFYKVSHERNADSRLPHCTKCWSDKSRETRRQLKAWYSSYASSHRGLRKKAKPKWLTPEQNEDILRIYEHAEDCRIVTGEPYEVDHIVPLKGKQVCGLHVPWNLQVLPMSVNRRKSNKMVL